MKTLFKAARIYDNLKILNSKQSKEILEKLKNGPKNAGELRHSYYLNKLLRCEAITMKRKRTFKIYSENPQGLLKWMKAGDEDFDVMCYMIGKSRVRRNLIAELLRKQEVQFPYSPLISSEVSKLKKAGLVNRRKEGKEAFWSATEKLKNLLTKIEEL